MAARLYWAVVRLRSQATGTVLPVAIANEMVSSAGLLLTDAVTEELVASGRVIFIPVILGAVEEAQRSSAPGRRWRQ